jgi:TPR repeat protein
MNLSARRSIIFILTPALLVLGVLFVARTVDTRKPVTVVNKQSKRDDFTWLMSKANAGCVQAMTVVGYSYANGWNVPKDETNAIIWYRKAADLGQVDAMVELGLCYAKGMCVLKDEVEAAKWFRKAADLGCAEAMVKVGIGYAYGRGVQEDKPEAAQWYRRAADLGNSSAMFMLGACYQSGEGVPTDEVAVVRWYRNAADLGQVDAMGELGVCYANGNGVPKDDVEAIKWFRMGADFGNVRAMDLLAAFYASGRGIPKDEVEATKWYRKAADLGNVTSMAELGVRYANGKGVPQDDIHAYAWLNIAAAQDVGYAPVRDLVRRRMTPAQVEEAQRLAVAYFDKIGRTSGALPDGARTKATNPSATGTGFFVTTDGYLLTACHVVTKAGTVKVSFRGTILVATVVRLDVANDVALLKVDGSFAALAVTPSRRVKLGADVFSVGFPNIELQGTAPKLTKGSINALSGILDDPRAFQISVPIQPGNSGGPLLDTSGNVVGVVVSQLDAVKTALITGALPQGVNYAIKSAYVQPLLDAIPEPSSLATAAKARPFDDAVKTAEDAVCIVWAYQ